MKLKKCLAVAATLTVAASLFTATNAVADTSGDFTFTVDGGAATVTGYTGSSKDVVIPDTLGGYPVAAIGEQAFLSQHLLSVVIPNTVTAIGVLAFYDNSLTSVELPSALVTIGADAFAGDYLSSITFPSHVAYIGYQAFVGQTPILMTAKFLGNAPTMSGNDGAAFDRAAPGFTIYRNFGATGFGQGSTWLGLPIEILPYVSSSADVTASVTSGVRSAGLTAAAFDAVEFSHAEQSVNTNVTLSVDDLTGANAGWNVTTVASDLTWTAVTGGPNTGSNLPASALAVTSVGQISTVAGDAWAGDTNTGALSSPVKVLSTSGGSGSYTAPLTLTLTVPGQASVGTYAGTLTTTISAAP